MNPDRWIKETNMINVVCLDSLIKNKINEQIDLRAFKLADGVSKAEDRSALLQQIQDLRVRLDCMTNPNRLDVAVKQLKLVVRLTKELHDSPKSLLSNLQQGVPDMEATINGTVVS